MHARTRALHCLLSALVRGELLDAPLEGIVDVCKEVLRPCVSWREELVEGVLHA